MANPRQVAPDAVLPPAPRAATGACPARHNLERQVLASIPGNVIKDQPGFSAFSPIFTQISDQMLFPWLINIIRDLIPVQDFPVSNNYHT